MERYLTIQVIQNENSDPTGLTVEQILRKQAGLTKRQISRAKFCSDGILKNGIQCRVTEMVFPGDMICVCVEEKSETSAHLEGMAAELNILYEDEDLLVVNKPAGLVTHPQGVHYDDTLANRAVAYFRGKGEEHAIRPIGRLDKDTSGIVVFAKNKLAASRLQKQREQKLFQKTYLAVVCGELPADGLTHRIEEAIGPDPHDRLKMQITPDGKHAVTYYRVLERRKDRSLVSLILDTGRTHQIRVHMAGIGHPLCDDPLYGEICEKKSRCSDEKTTSRARLHAWKVKLVQPLTGEVLEFEAGMPEDYFFDDVAEGLKCASPS